MKRALTSAQMKELEQHAGTRLGMSEALLMENAGGALADEAVRLASSQGRFLVMCGRGNNAGDGLVAARHSMPNVRQFARYLRQEHEELMTITGKR